MSDLISRQAAIDAILKIHPIDTEYDCTLYDKIDVMYVLKDLPPVNPQESKTRHWIPCSEMMPNESGKYWCTFGETNLMGIDFYTTESYAKKWFDEPEEYIGWESKNVSAWMPLPEPYKAESEDKGMNREQAKNMLKAKLECLKSETSGTDFDCNNSNCDECSLYYEQDNVGEQKEALDMAIKALEKQDRIAQILDDYDLLDTWEVLEMIKEVMKEDKKYRCEH